MPSPHAPRFALSTEPLLLFLVAAGIFPFTLEGEWAIAERLSLLGAGGVSVFTLVGQGFSIGGTLGARLFLLGGPAPGGLWLSATGRLGWLSVGLAGQSAALATGDVTGMLGYTLLIAGRLYLSAGLGVSYAHGEVRLGDFTFGATGPLPAARLSVGWAF